MSTLSLFTHFRNEFEVTLQRTVESVESRRQTQLVGDLSEEDKDAIVDSVVASASYSAVCSEGSEEPWRSEVKRSIIDKGLEAMVLDAAMNQPESTNESDPAPYDILADLLDIILKFSERELADPALPLVCIAALLDVQTISGCTHIFSYLESRVDRLIVDMSPGKGKGLILLRLLNELLRRLPKSKTEHVVFCGRILMFLSSSFPLGEKSGVNLRGNFNTSKVTLFESQIDEKVEATPKEEVEGVTEPQAGASDVKTEELKMDVDTKQVDDFYTVFWSLQRFFTNPPSLFQASASVDPFTDLRTGISRTLDAFAVATQREKELLGAGKEGGERKAGKRKAEENDDEEEVIHHYFFPKFLTSRKLLELEIEDPTFRRQILIQCLVLFQYLLAFTTRERVKWISLKGPIPSSQQSFELSKPNEDFINDLRSRTIAEMEAMPGGVKFRQTVELILRREQNWINWKLTGCHAFGRPPLDAEVSETASNKLRGVVRKLKAWPYKIGNPVLSRVWQRNLTSLQAFQPDPTKDTFDQLLRDWRMTQRIIAQRKTQIIAAPTSVPLLNQLEQLEKKSKSLHWRAIRLASIHHLHLFHKIEAGDLEALVTLMDAERQELEERLNPVAAVLETEDAVEDVESEELVAAVAETTRIKDGESDDNATQGLGAQKVETMETISEEKIVVTGTLSPVSKRARVEDEELPAALEGVASESVTDETVPKKKTRFGP